MKIIINGDTINTDALYLSYEQVVELAGKQGHPTVTYSGPRHGDSRRSGEMHTGCNPVKLDEGMVFSAIHTGNA